MNNRSEHIRGLILALTLLASLVLVGQSVTAQQTFEEIAVGFEIPRLTDVDMVVMYDGEQLFVPLIELFTRLGIHIEPHPERQVYEGKFYTDDKEYFVDLKNSEARCFGYTTKLKQSDYYQGDLELYLRIDLFKEIFDLDLQFSFSSLKISLKLDVNFPSYQKMKRETAHKDLKSKKDDSRSYHRLDMNRSYFNGAAMDWMLSTNPIGSNRVHYMDLTLGSMLLGGDLSLSGTGNSKTGFQADQVSYRWHYYIPNNNYLTQVDVGEMSSSGAVSRSLSGVAITNRPQIRRNYFQTINLSGQLSEGWEVELYVNNQLTDFTVVGADQLYNFDVDIFYGSSRVKLKMYGPNGEIKTEEKYISVPHNIVPKKTFEYSFMAGQSKVDSESQLFGVTSAHYGLFNRLTVGMNHELPLGDKQELGQQVGFTMTYQPFGELSISSGLSPGYSKEVAMTYSKPSLLSATVGYSVFDPLSVRNFARRERSTRFSINAPFRFGNNVIAARYSISLDRYGQQDATNMNYGLNSSLGKFHLSYIGNYKVSKYANQSFKDLNSKILFMTSLIRWVRPQFRMDYNHMDQQITSMSVYLNKRLFGSAQMSLQLTRNMITETNQVVVSLDLYNSFARFSSKFLGSKGHNSMSQIQRGSIRYNNVTHDVDFSRDNAVGFGSAVLRPFMDDNYNGQIDDGEEYLTDTNVGVEGLSGRSIIGSEQQTYGKLRPYYNYQLSIDPTSLDNPMIRPVYENYEIAFTPNVVTSVDVPLALGSEVTGYVQRETSKGKSGVGGVKIQFYNLSNETVTEITTFVNGDFYYLGLLPGKYIAYPDRSVLEQYGYESFPKEIELTITPAEGGGSIEDVNFLLKPKVSTETTEQEN